jgi:integrase
MVRTLERERQGLRCAGKDPDTARMKDKGEWRPAEQGRLMAEAVARANISLPISFHGLRHTWASLATMAGVPLMVVAKNLGHVDTRMVEIQYGHLAPSFIVDAIRSRAPKFGDPPKTNVARLR